MKKLSQKKFNGRLILFTALSALCLYATYVYLFLAQKGYDHILVTLAKQFLTRHTVLPIYNLPLIDVANYYNNYYVYFGPMPSFFLMPFVFLFKDVPQVMLGVTSMIVSFISIYFISKHFKFNKIDSLWLALFFVFSTVLYAASVVNITAIQVQSFAIQFVLLALWAYFAKKNSFLIGVFLAFAIMTRFTLMLSVAFFFFEVLQKRFTIKQFALLLIPIILALAILGAYNDRRFHSIFETGYSYNNGLHTGTISLNLKYGDKGLIHVPANLYSFLLMAPEPLLQDKYGSLVLRFPYIKASPWGLAIWFTSPLFLLLLVGFKKGKYTLSAFLTSVLLSVPVFLWYSIGYAQFGYRYVLDFLPFLFLILIPYLSPKLSKTAITLITIGVIFNCIYIESIWELYPVLGIFK